MPIQLKPLLACYEAPGYGGASTATYELFKALRRDGIDASFVNLIEEQDADYYRYTLGENYGNPSLLQNVHNVVLTDPLFRPQPKLAALLQQLAPTRLIGVGWIAATLLKQAAPDSLLFFLTTGSEVLKQAIEQGLVMDFLGEERIMGATARTPVFPLTGEKRAVELADLVLVHSDMTMLLHRYYYWSQVGKIYSSIIWMAEWIYQAALVSSDFRQPFLERDIEVLFVASSWSRPEKSYRLVKKIASSLRGRSIHVVGSVEERLPGVVHHGLIRSGAEIFRLMGRAKSVVCPSVFDAAPGVLFEASAMGCNIVASKNCGNWRLCNDRLLVDPFDSDGFIQKTRLALTCKFEDNISYFLDAKSYDRLLDVLSVDWGGA